MDPAQKVLLFFFHARHEAVVSLHSQNNTFKGIDLAFLRLACEASDLHFLNFSKALRHISSCFSIYLFLSFKLVTKFTN